MGHCRRLFLCVSLFVAFSTPAQQSGPPQSRGNRIYLDVVAAPKSGLPLSGLQQQDFTLLDDKVPQTITSFHALDERQAADDVLIVVDAVNADYRTVAYERDQIEKFLRADRGDLIHAISLAVLTDTGVQVLADFSKDGNSLAATFDRYTVGLRFLNRNAGFYGATERFQISLEGLHELTKREASRPGRKLMIWVSPGWPLLSGPEVEIDSKEQRQLFADIVGFSSAFLQERITLYSVDPLGANENVAREFYWENFVKGISKPSQVLPGNLGLEVLATQTGGVALNSNNDISALIQTCLADTRAYYELSFDAPAGDQPDKYHRLEVRVAKAGLSGRTLQGYYSQPTLGWEPMRSIPIQKR